MLVPSPAGSFALRMNIALRDIHVLVPGEVCQCPRVHMWRHVAPNGSDRCVEGRKSSKGSNLRSLKALFRRNFGSFNNRPAVLFL